MNKLIGTILLLALFFNLSCGNAGTKETDVQVKIETEFGDIILKLYDETPQHRDNFLKLAREGFYDGLLFHRVIQNFMVQGGDPASKNAQPGQRLGGGDPGYTIPAEINPAFFHKKGALAAARQGDLQNPEKRSSGSQFYIVQGTVFTNGALDSLEMQLNARRTQDIHRKYFAQQQQELNQLRQAGEQDQFAVRVAEIREAAEKEIAALPPFKIDAEKRNAYTTVGGYPSLDMNYTVFGEVVEGLDVLEKIAAVETDQFDRPKTDLKMKVKVIE
ncbi:MAG: peptidylprolyl isomerase [Mangrovibacterium sp.]